MISITCCNSSNKLFKSDSQRVAFLLCVDFSDYGGVRRLLYCVAHPLTGRYVTGLEKRILWTRKSYRLEKKFKSCHF